MEYKTILASVQAALDDIENNFSPRSGQPYYKVNGPDDTPLLFINTNEANGRRLLIPSLSPRTELDKKVSESIRLSIVTEHFAEYPFMDKFLCVDCTNREHNKIFDRLTLQFISSLYTTRKPPEDEFLSVVEDWRQFLAFARDNPLSTRFIGLFGELLVLRHLAQAHGAAALTTWAGPQGQLHDFVSDSCDMEVKTTLSPKHEILSVTNCQQLFTTEGVPLYLARIALREHPKGQTREEIIQDIEKAGINHLDLLDTVNRILLPDEREEYSGKSYMVVSENIYPVDDGFPRLDLDAFEEWPAGIVNVSYDIDLSYAHCLADEETKDFFKHFHIAKDLP